MTRSSERDEPVPSHNALAANRVLHQAGTKVAEAVGLKPHELAALTPARALPSWESSLRVGELADDSAALASLAIALVSVARGRASVGDLAINPRATRVQASFGSEKLFRIDGAAPSIWAPLSGFWRVRDGWVRTHGNYPHHAERLARLLGLSADAERSAVAAAMRHWSRFEIEQQAADAGALVIAVRDHAEWRGHPQYQVLERSPILAYRSVGDAAPRAWRDTGGLPLSGIRVLDLTRVIAGPVATRDLAIAGADVLRVDSPRLPEAAWQHLDTGQEKRTALLDFEEQRDLSTLHQLLAQADVVVHGYRPHALARYGIDFESLQQRFPGIIVAQLSAWGTEGPWGSRRGFDSLVQAASGIAVLESKDGGATPGALPTQALDHSAGHFLSAAVSAALRTQRSFGGSFEISISLARIANELLAAGRSECPRAASGEAQLPTVRVRLGSVSDGAPVTVTCAPPILDFPGAPSEYRSPLLPWGVSRPAWAR